MEMVEASILLLSIIVIMGQLFKKTIIPLSIILVITGMCLSFIPDFPSFTLNPDTVLNIFLPILVYEIAAFFPWLEVKRNLRPITLLSIGHVVFITVLIAMVIHYLIPELSWPLCIVVGAIISPPDDVAIVTIAEKIRLPRRIISILEGEGLFNDATALIIFRFALAAAITHQFSPLTGFATFLLVIVGETIYGLFLGFAIGELRLKIDNPMLNFIASVVTPFFAFLPPEQLGGSGIISTVVTGLIIGHRYLVQFTPEYRLVSRSMWLTMAFIIQSIIFLLVGLDLRSILESISSIPAYHLIGYSAAIILTIIIGRFIWVFGAVYFLPRALFPRIRQKDPYPPWQAPFIISWSGMRGGISLAAALAIPNLPMSIDGANVRNLIVFLVFATIMATLILQGLSLPWIIKKIGLKELGEQEKYDEHLSELNATLKMYKSVVHWLKKYLHEIPDDPKLQEETKMYLAQFSLLKNQLQERIGGHELEEEHDEYKEREKQNVLSCQIITVQKEKLFSMWEQGKIEQGVRDRLLEKLDHLAKNLSQS